MGAGGELFEKKTTLVQSKEKTEIWKIPRMRLLHVRIQDPDSEELEKPMVVFTWKVTTRV